MFAPSEVEIASSVSHWDMALFPNELMEPIPIGNHERTLTESLLADIGWPLNVVQPPPPGTGDCPHGTFSVSETGTVCTRGAYSSGSGSFNAGRGDDLAERIDASERLELGFSHRTDGCG